MKKKGFTLIELLVVIAIISLLSSIVFASLKNTRMKARDARRQLDMQQIYNALMLYNNTYNCLPITSGTTCPGAGSYSEFNAGGWDYSSQGGFMTFLQNSGFMSKVSVDPLNNMTGDASPAGTYSYRYYCYSTGLHLGYWRENDGQYVTNNVLNNPNWTDPSFICK